MQYINENINNNGRILKLESIKVLPVMILVFLLLFSNSLQAQERKKVLLISSYNSSFPTFFRQINGIKSVFDTAQIDLDLEFMDSKRFIEKENTENFARLLSYKLSKTSKYDAVISTDDNALKFVLKFQDSLFSETPIVFCGVNNIRLAKEQNNNHQVTGVIEATSMKETIDLMLKLSPGSEKIYAIVDSTQSGQSDLITYYGLANAYTNIDFDEISMHKMSFNEYAKKLGEISPKNPVLLLSAYHDKTRKTIDFNESIGMISDNLNAPLYHLWYHGMGDGVLGGKIISHFMQGQTAANTVYNILNGQNIADIKVLSESPNVYMFDYNEIVRFGIEKELLPKNSTIINEPQTFYAKNKTIIFITVVVFIMLIAFIFILSINILKRRKVEKALKKQNKEYSILNKDFKKQNKKLNKAKEKAEENEKKFRSLVETTSDWIWEIDAEGSFSYVSPKVKDLLGYEPEELIGKNAFDLMSPEEAARVDAVYSKFVKNKEPFSGMINVNIHKEGHEVIIESNGSPILNSKGDLVGYRGIDRDISDIRKAENDLAIQYKELLASEEELKATNDELIKTSEELEISNKKLTAAKEKAEESNQLKTEFIQNMSHEIRTPMNGILGFSNFLKKDNLSPEKRLHYVNVIRSSGKQLLRIIDDILEISVLETKQVNIVETAVCLNDLLFEQFSIFHDKAEKNNTPLRLVKGLSDKESFILTDVNKLVKILGNLMENALKFTHKGFIEIGYKLVGNKIEIYVKDTGVGIRDDMLKSIFERFSQEEKELSKKYGGLGLGLSIAKENAELLGGTIIVQSEKGEGSTFFVSIPYKPFEPKRKKEKQPFDKKQKELEHHIILIVEDEETNYMFIKTLLEEIGLNCTIYHSKNGKEAVELCQTNNEIDLILMDLKMPVMNGFEASKKIKTIRPNLPIIAQTAYSTKEDKEKALLAGCEDFITKPINEEVFDVILKRYLKKNQN